MSAETLLCPLPILQKPSLQIDLAARELDSFAPDENGKYTVKYFRFDFFNKTYSADVSYDIEYMAFSDSLEDIYSLESDMDFVTLCKGEKGTSKIDPKTGNEIIE